MCPAMMAETRTPERRILVIEDESDIRDLLSYNFQSNGYAVKTADTGKLGLEAFESFIPDVVLLDLMLPDVPGTEICRRIRASPGRDAIGWRRRRSPPGRAIGIPFPERAFPDM